MVLLDDIAAEARRLFGTENAGHATDDEQLEAEGKGDQAKGNLKQAAENVKDVFKD